MGPAVVTLEWTSGKEAATSGFNPKLHYTAETHELGCGFLTDLNLTLVALELD